MLGILEDAEWVSKDWCLSWKGKVGGGKPSKEHRIHWDGLSKHNQGRIVQNQETATWCERRPQRPVWGFWPQTQWLPTEWDANIVFCYLTYILMPFPLPLHLFCKPSVSECLTLWTWDDFHVLLNFLGQLRGLQTRWKSFVMCRPGERSFWCVWTSPDPCTWLCFCFQHVVQLQNPSSMGVSSYFTAETVSNIYVGVGLKIPSE